MPDTVASVWSSFVPALSGIFGAGFAAWVIRIGIQRNLKKIDDLDHGVALINSSLAAINVKLSDIVDVRKDIIRIELDMKELKTRVDICRDLHRTDTETVNALQIKFSNIERDIAVTREKLMKKPG